MFVGKFLKAVLEAGGDRDLREKQTSGCHQEAEGTGAQNILDEIWEKLNSTRQTKI